MIFVNKQANYTDISIGEVEIPLDLSEETQALLAKYTKTLTNSQKGQVNEFVNALVDAGLWESIVNLYMPILAATPTEALYNYARDSAHAVADTNGFYVIGDKGIKTNKNAATKSIVSIESTGTYSNATFVGARMEEGLTSLPAKVLLYDKRTSLYLYNGFAYFINSSNWPTSNPTINTDIDRNLVFASLKDNAQNVFYSANIKRLLNSEALDAFAETWDGDSLSYAGANDNLYIASYNNTNNDSGNNEVLVVIQLASATDAEMVTISNAIKSLIDQF